MILIYKFIQKIFYLLLNLLEKIISMIILYGNNISFSNFRTSGIPYIMVARGGKCKIGKNFAMNNGIKGNPIGCYQKCTIFVDRGAELIIGNNVGISQTALICTKKIIIENHVKIGGGVCIYDTDFHSLNPDIRKSSEDLKHRKQKEILIKENAFIGAHSIILKGVTIGKNSIVGAGSVVTKSIPDNEIWAGNPAKFIKKITE
jgi:acetyltransferase-like isoleucine patch superfamily enzyme